MSLHYLVKHEIAICGTWQHYFYNFGDVKKVFLNLNTNFIRPEVWPPNSPVDYKIWGLMQDRNTWCRQTEVAVWSPSGPTWSRAWSTRLLMNGAQDSRRVFVPRDDILNICFVEHEHYFFACLTVCLRNLITSPKLRRQHFVFHKLQFRVLQGSVETLFRWSKNTCIVLWQINSG